LNKPQPGIRAASPDGTPQKAPPVFRPAVMAPVKPRISVQPKAAMSFRLETRPAPPVYRPQENISQLKPAGASRTALSQGRISAPPGVQPKFSFLATTIQRAKKAESTSVRLKIKDTWYAGETGQDHGHAEMDALHRYIDAQGGVDKAVAHFKRARGLVVECTEKSVCVRCTLVLKTLGFECSEDTVWGVDPMGSTEWGASMNVKAFLKEYGLDVEKIAK